MITLHGSEWKLSDVAEQVGQCLNQKWHKETWKPTPALIHKTGGVSSSYHGQAFDSEKINLVPDGWNHDHCLICWHTLHEAEKEEDGTGYKNKENGWLCCECFEKLVQPAIKRSELGH